MSDAGALTIELAILSRPGGREYNEDACGHWHSDRHICCVVADGVGGHGGGDVASRLAVQHLITQYSSAPLGQPEEVQELLRDTNVAVIRHRESDGSPQLADMHSTVVALFVELETGRALWGHVGDSRLYLFRDDQMLAHTRDHSFVQSLVDAGMLSSEQLRNHPKRSELLSALGTDPEQLLVTASAKPWSLQPGDVFLLCTDGLWEYVDEAEMCSSLARADDAQLWVNALEALVLKNAAAQGKRNHDNFSAISIWFGAA